MQPAVVLQPASGAAPAGGIPLAALRLVRSLDWPAGQAEAELSGAVQPPDPGAAVTLTAAADASAAAAVIFTGRVLRREVGPWGTRLVLEEATGPLTRLRVDAVFKSSTAAAVVQDLAGRAQVQASIEGTGAQLPFFAVLSSRSAMDYIVQLALLSGWLLRTDAHGTLKATAGGALGAAAGAAASALGGGGALGPASGPVLGLSADALDGDPPTPALLGDGAYSRQGPGAESWLLKDPSALKAGAGPGVLLLPALKTPMDVQAAQMGLHQRLAEATRERRLLLMGPPPADLGDTVTLTGFPGVGPQARVAGIGVLWHARTGLQTQLTLHGLS